MVPRFICIVPSHVFLDQLVSHEVLNCMVVFKREDDSSHIPPKYLIFFDSSVGADLISERSVC